MKKSKKKTTGVLVGVIILNLLLVGAYVYAFYSVKVKNEEASLVSEELEEYLSKEGDINVLRKIVKDKKDDREKLETYFVARDDIPEFARKIESLGGMSGVKLAIVGLSTQEDVLSFDLSSQGSFKDTLHLISLIESLPFKVDITKAYLDMGEAEIPEEDGGGSRIVWEGNFNVELVGFVAK